MCGRYGRRADKQRIAEAMQAGDVNVFEEEIVPSYNVAPQTFQPVVRLNRDDEREEDATQFLEAGEDASVTLEAAEEALIAGGTALLPNAFRMGFPSQRSPRSSEILRAS
jgi:hypothetical protein